MVCVGLHGCVSIWDVGCVLVWKTGMQAGSHIACVASLLHTCVKETGEKKKQKATECQKQREKNRERKTMCMCLCICVCVCVWRRVMGERETKKNRERERERVLSVIRYKQRGQFTLIRKKHQYSLTWPIYHNSYPMESIIDMWCGISETFPQCHGIHWTEWCQHDD